MGLFNKYKQQSALNRLQEEHLFAFVLEELEKGEAKPGLYAQALVTAEGDEKKAGAAYIKLRVQSLKDEYTIEQLVNEVYRQTTIAMETKSGSNTRRPHKDDLAAHEAHVKRQEELELKASEKGKSENFWSNLESDFRRAREEDWKNK